MSTFSNSIKKYTYHNLVDFPEDREDKSPTEKIPKNLLKDFLKILGQESLKEDQPKLEEIEQELQNLKKEKDKEKKCDQSSADESRPGGRASSIITQLQESGYIRESRKWLSKKGFFAVGGRLLEDVIRALNKGSIGLHETTFSGSGSINLDSTKKYEPSDDLRLINVPRSLLNAIGRRYGSSSSIQLPIDLRPDDLEIYETKRDVNVAIAYCIDLSSTMRYSTMYGDMSRIEAAKRALWSLYLLNRKFFPSDSVYIVGFGALASKVLPQDIPYLKTFEPGSDFLHDTNYQAAFRLASKILQKDGAENKRVVLVTDGHPSACFIDEKSEQDKILAERPYSHFYTPDRQTLDTVKQD